MMRKLVLILLMVSFSCSKKQSKNNDFTGSEINLKSNVSQVDYIKEFFSIKGRYWVDRFGIFQFENRDSVIVRNKYLFNLKVDSRKVKLNLESGDTIYNVLGIKESFKILRDGTLEVYEDNKLQYSLPLQKTK